MKRPLAALAASLLMIGAAAITAPAATADTIDRTQSCWQELDTGKSLCVDADANLADAVYEAYGIVLSTPDGTLEVSDELVNDSSSARSDVAPLASTVIGIFYEHNNYGGASYAASVTQNGCYGASPVSAGTTGSRRSGRTRTARPRFSRTPTTAARPTVTT